MGQADFFKSGAWNAVCFRCGRKFKSSALVKNWQGFYTCRRCFEPRHPQDFVKGVPDRQTPPWSQPPQADAFATFCTPAGVQALPGLATPGCLIPGRNDHLDPSRWGFCTITGGWSMAGFAQAGCWTVGVIS